MALVVPNQQGEILFLQYIVGLVAAGSPVLHLYGNLSPDPSLDPTDTTVIGDITECTSPGYHPITLTSANWTASQSGGGVTVVTYSDQSFTFSTDAVVYGYFVTNTSGHLMWLEKFLTAPYEVPPDGGAIVVQPLLSIL